jgi:hypothetical protein
MELKGLGVFACLDSLRIADASALALEALAPS